LFTVLKPQKLEKPTVRCFDPSVSGIVSETSLAPPARQHTPMFQSPYDLGLSLCFPFQIRDPIPSSPSCRHSFGKLRARPEQRRRNRLSAKWNIEPLHDKV
jgi:hypothetical protein